MADKNDVTSWSENQADNTDIGGVPLGENIMMPSFVNNALRTMMAQLKAFFKSTVFQIWDGADPTKKLAFDLSALAPATTATLAVRYGGAVITDASPDLRRSRLVNGDKLVSQENGQTAGTTNGRYLSDQNAMYFVTGTGVFTGVNVQTVSPAGGFRDRITITTADASLGASEYLSYAQNIEGSNIRDAKWGTAAAKPIVVQRGFRYPAGTWPIAFHNSANDWSYVTTFTVSAAEAGTDIVRDFAIPAQTAGTWLSTNGVNGLTMEAVIGAGSTLQGVAGWQNSFKMTVAAASNGMAMAGAVFEFFDEGLKLDPDATGVYGTYKVGEVDAVYRPERYFKRKTATGNIQLPMAGFGYAAGSGTANQLWADSTFAVEMCKAPTGQVSSAADFTIYASATTLAATGLALNGADRYGASWITTNAGYSANIPGMLLANKAGAWIQYNSRLS